MKKKKKRQDRKKNGIASLKSFLPRKAQGMNDICPSLEVSLKRFFGYRKGQFYFPFPCGKDISGLLTSGFLM